MHFDRVPGPGGVLEGRKARLLARLFSAISAGHALPEDFPLGRVVPLPKGDLAACPGSYRAVALASPAKRRLQIPGADPRHKLWVRTMPHQTTLLQGRKIKDSIYRLSCWALLKQ
jgi:hypothetical protein